MSGLDCERVREPPVGGRMSDLRSKLNINGIYGYRRSNKYDSRERFLIDLRLIKT